MAGVAGLRVLGVDFSGAETSVVAGTSLCVGASTGVGAGSVIGDGTAAESIEASAGSVGGLAAAVFGRGMSSQAGAATSNEGGGGQFRLLLAAVATGLRRLRQRWRRRRRQWRRRCLLACIGCRGGGW